MATFTGLLFHILSEELGICLLVDLFGHDGDLLLLLFGLTYSLLNSKGNVIEVLF